MFGVTICSCLLVDPDYETTRSLCLELRRLQGTIEDYEVRRDWLLWT